MSFWIIAAAGAALVTVLLARALTRGASAPAETGAAHDVQVYRDQLAEVERDVARGVLPEADAIRVRTEISRRILAADAAGQNTPAASGTPSPVVIVVIGLVLVLSWYVCSVQYVSSLAIGGKCRQTRRCEGKKKGSIPSLVKIL